MENFEKQSVCMNISLNCILFLNKCRFFEVASNYLVNKSSRDSNKKISQKCCRTYYCNAKKCIQSDPEVNLTPNDVYRRNYKLWIKGKHLTCDVMKKFVRTKKNDIQPALKKIFEWFEWEMKHYPCSCNVCSNLRLFLKEDIVPTVQYRCPKCLCGLKEHNCLNVPCHKDGVCQGIKYCSYCFKYKASCNFSLMIREMKYNVNSNEYDLPRFVFESSVNICNLCFNNKRGVFINSLHTREKLLKSISIENKKVGMLHKKTKKNTLPEDILLKDEGWDTPRDLTFLETRQHLIKLVEEMKTMLYMFHAKKKCCITDFKCKLENVKKGDWTDKTFIEQIVMLVEKKKRPNIVVNVKNGFVNIIQTTDKKI
tara:strand:+ start:3970 stop:5073 length:1104 start_codon:yes stop_codon:yes gene_type:complete